MSKALLEAPVPYPRCCDGCRHLDSEWDELTYTSSYFCKKNIFLPCKKNTCKAREPRSPK